MDLSLIINTFFSLYFILQIIFFAYYYFCRSQQSNQVQLKLLVQYMEDHTALARNGLQNSVRGKLKKQKLWAKLTEMCIFNSSKFYSFAINYELLKQLATQKCQIFKPNITAVTHGLLVYLRFRQHRKR